MSNEEWWAAERKAAEFWRKVKEYQQSGHGGMRPYYENGAAPNAKLGTPMRRRSPELQSCATF